MVRCTRAATDRPVKDRKHPLYRCSGRTYLGNHLSPSSSSEADCHWEAMATKSKRSCAHKSSTAVHDLSAVRHQCQSARWSFTKPNRSKFQGSLPKSDPKRPSGLGDKHSDLGTVCGAFSIESGLSCAFFRYRIGTRTPALRFHLRRPFSKQPRLY
jgi:hypothetical protein